MCTDGFKGCGTYLQGHEVHDRAHRALAAAVAGAGQLPHAFGVPEAHHQLHLVLRDRAGLHHLHLAVVLQRFHELLEAVVELARHHHRVLLPCLDALAVLGFKVLQAIFHDVELLLGPGGLLHQLLVPLDDLRVVHRVVDLGLHVQRKVRE